jgi:hypothetical protein
MTRTRCQICGRAKHLRKDCAIVHHFTQGDLCPGAGFAPIEQDDARLLGYAAEIEARLQAVRAELRALEDRRANWIDPALLARRRALGELWLKLDRRARRHQGWAERYARSYDRQMMTQGYAWADKPPPYLISRFLENRDWTPPAFR